MNSRPRQSSDGIRHSLLPQDKPSKRTYFHTISPEFLIQSIASIVWPFQWTPVHSFCKELCESVILGNSCKFLGVREGTWCGNYNWLCSNTRNWCTMFLILGLRLTLRELEIKVDVTLSLNDCSLPPSLTLNTTANPIKTLQVTHFITFLQHKSHYTRNHTKIQI